MFKRKVPVDWDFKPLNLASKLNLNVDIESAKVIDLAKEKEQTCGNKDS